MAETRFALLIDAENIPAKYAQNILAEVEKHGTCLYKRIYGNPDCIVNSDWQDAVKEYSLTPRIQINNTRGKNASDSALIIDAMDILHAGNVTGFCIVSSDSDYTYLARRISESGCKVWGMGESEKVTEALKNAYEKYIYIDLLAQQAEEEKCAAKAVEDAKAKNTQQKQKATSKDAKATANIPGKKTIEAYIQQLIKECNDKNKPANLGFIGSELNRIYKNFDVRYYAKKGGTRYKYLKDFVNDFNSLKVDKNNNVVPIA
ncbi:NYN domain-containing protein [Atopobium fossor]|uniref:NYN domain-containing protein n=1 Tax=Atopobium fossor TaxID=39487 RepID=UPI000401F919|nr:NYN domain-containing protein [Atopobium fossor]